MPRIIINHAKKDFDITGACTHDIFADVEIASMPCQKPEETTADTCIDCWLPFAHRVELEKD